MNETRPEAMTRRTPGILLTAAVFACVCVVLLLAGCSDRASWYQPRIPTTHLRASERCPASVGKARDVRPGDASMTGLVPAGAQPVGGLVCIYGSRLNPSPPVRQIKLDASRASQLTAALSTVSLKAPPAGPVNCPADLGNVTIMSLAFHKTEDVNIWWATSGCQTLDNGTVGASQVANNSFARFQTIFAVIAGTPDGA